MEKRRNTPVGIMNAESTLCLLVAIIHVLQLSGKQQDNTCVSPQYLELTGTGTISCTFQDNRFSLFWYNTTDYFQNEPILRYQNSIKSGIGYDSGEYDVYPNGSLSINKVSWQHDRNFTVAFYPTDEEQPISIYVRVIVTHETLARCPSPQFGQVGDHQIIRCVITLHFESISWYKEGLDDAIVTYGRKSTRDISDAPEHDNDDYGLLIDGSLIIYEVGPEMSNLTYTVELFDSDTVGKLSITVEFIAVKGAQPTSSPTVVPKKDYKSTIMYNLPDVSEQPSQKITYQGRFDVPNLIFNLLSLFFMALIVAFFLFNWKRRKVLAHQAP